MAYIKPTTAGSKFLGKQATPADISAVTAVQLYEKQAGSDGVANTTFTLSKQYLPGTNTLWVFLNGQKLEVGNEYTETNALTVTFASALADTDVVEFMVAGAYRVDADELTSAFGQMPERKNYLINGDFRIAQRGVSFTDPADSDYALDRVKTKIAGSACTGTWSQVADGPSGTSLNYCLDYTCSSAAEDVSGPKTLRWDYMLEGLDLEHLADQWVTLSFWVKSTKTGQASIGFRPTANDASYNATYTINASAQWEYKSVSVYLDTTKGTWGFTNSDALRIHFNLFNSSDLLHAPGVWNTSTPADVGATGDANLLDTIGNSVRFTGVKLEAGSIATDFVARPYAEELALCQRYYYNIGVSKLMACGLTGSTNVLSFYVPLPVPMRDTPTVITSNSIDFRYGGSSYLVSSSEIGTATLKAPQGISVGTSQSGAGANTAGYAVINNYSAIDVDAEL
jgi:hypothetical protein